MQNTLSELIRSTYPTQASALLPKPFEDSFDTVSSRLHLPDVGLIQPPLHASIEEYAVGYPFGVWHPLYNPSSWRKAPTASKLLYLGMAVEQSFSAARAVTITPSAKFVKAMMATGDTPHEFINRKFHNNCLSNLPRVGVIEYGRKDKRTKFPQGDEDRIHLHFWIDVGTRSDSQLRTRIMRCFSFGKNDLPDVRGRYPHMIPIRFQSSQAKGPFNLAETGGPGWLLYAAMRNIETRRHLGIPVEGVLSFRSKFGRHFDKCYKPGNLSALHFPEIVFSDSGTLRIAKEIHRLSMADKRYLYGRLFALDDLNHHNIGMRPYEEIDYDPRYRH